MACSGRLAEAWQFAAFWCVTSMLRGADDSGGAGNASLQDLDGDFVDRGVQPNVGMVLYNVTRSTSGPVTAVSATALTATGVLWWGGDIYRLVTITGEEIATIEHYLDIAAGDVHAALAATGACDCTLADWAANFLAKLNIIDAASYYNCPCGQPNMSDDTRAGYLRWCGEQLTAIVTGRLEVCHGATGSDFPAVAAAERAWNEFAAAGIIYNAGLRNG